MALAVRLLPRLLFCGSLPGGAARPRPSRAAEVRPPLAVLCCFCRRHHLGSRTSPFLSVTWVSAASPLPALGPQRPLLSPPGLAAALPLFPVGARRSYSTEEQPQQRQKTKMFILGFSNPINWIRTRIYAFLIWAYFDKEFNITEFSEGAKQAFAHVSKLLSECKFDLLEELVAKEVLQVLKEKVTSLPDNHKNALAADIDEIVYTSTGDISIYYDEKAQSLPDFYIRRCNHQAWQSERGWNGSLSSFWQLVLITWQQEMFPPLIFVLTTGRKFVSILMCFWYLTSANIPSETLSGASVFQVKLGDQNVETKQLLSASYEFHREFTQGVKPDWTISRIDHSKLLE